MLMPEEIVKQVATHTRKMPPAESLKYLFELETRLYKYLGKESVRYGGGVHTKHKHIKYHDFFIENIYPEDRVLDIGCGNGAVDIDIAHKVLEVDIVGIDLNPENIQYAQQHHMQISTLGKTTYLVGDALERDWKPWEFDVVILSNVLEHIGIRKDRVVLLKKVALIFPQRILLRVPMFKRDWRVPLKKELGIDYMLDDTHYIEYTQEELDYELKAAGLKNVFQKTNWGEFWVIAEVVESVNVS